MRRFKGFTLTELMIALTVIGIIVAVVTPAIMKSRPNKNKMMVKKTFYTTENIISNLINDENLYPDMRDLCKPGAESSGDSKIYCAWGFDYSEEGMFDGEKYDAEGKFAALFKDNLNVSKDISNCEGSSVTVSDRSVCTKFYTTDGVLWDIQGTVDAWTSGQDKVGTFDDQTDAAGIGTITIDVNGDEEPNLACTKANDDCDQYEIQILANGKLRINPDHERAIEYVTINTSIKDEL